MSDEIDRLLGERPRIGGNVRRVPIWLLALALVAALGIAGAAYYLLRPLEAPIPADAGARYAAFEQGSTDDGFPTLGPADAPMVVEVFSSFACPHCRDFSEDHFDGLADAIAAGEARFVFIPVAHIGPGADRAAEAALCAGEQGAFWPMHDVLFAWQASFLTQTFAERRIALGVENMGLDAAAFEACLDSGRADAVLDRARQEFDRRGLRGTPSVFLNGERVEDYAELDVLGGTD